MQFNSVVFKRKSDNLLQFIILMMKNYNYIIILEILQLYNNFRNLINNGEHEKRHEGIGRET